MVAVLALARAELRRSWRHLLVLGLVVAVGVGSVMVAAAGARRADTSFARFREAVRDGNLFVGIPAAPERVIELRDLPVVRTVAPLGYVPIYPPGAPDEATIEGGGFASLDGRWLYDIQRPRVLSGRMPPADVSDQMMVNEEFVRWFDVAVGDVVRMEAATAASMASEGQAQETLPVDLEVAAVVRTPLDIGVNVGGPVVYLPPGVLQSKPDIGVVQGFALIELVRGDADRPTFERLARELFADEPSYTASSLDVDGRTVERAIDVQVTALISVAFVAGLTALALVIQLAAREVRRAEEATRAMRSLGATRAQRTTALALPTIMVTIVAVAGAAVAAAVLSPLLPRGLARLTEPDPGIRVDVAAIAASAGAAVALLTAVVLLVAARATAGEGRSPGASTGIIQRATMLAHRRGAPLPLVTGLRLAVPPREGGEQWAGIAGYVGLIFGIAGLLTVAMFGTELSRVARDSAAWGAPFDLLVAAGDLDVTERELAGAVAKEPGVEGVTAMRYSEQVALGDGTAPAFGLDAVEGELLLTVVQGRSPAATGEVLVGMQTATALDLQVGGALHLASRDGPIELEVVGLGLMPIIGDNTYDNGIAVRGEDFAAIDDGEATTSLLVDLMDGADRREVSAALSRDGASISRVSAPGEQLNLRSTLAYPKLVAILVAVLGLAGLGSALLSGASGRRLELATLRAVGFTPSQVRSSLTCQSLAAGVIGVVVAVPLAIVAARTAWTTFAGTLSLDPTFAVSWAVPVAVVLGSLCVAAVAAVPVAWRWSRRPPAIDLRAV